MSPTVIAERAERESRKTLVMRLGWGALAVLLLVAIYAAFELYEAGRRTSNQPGYAEFREASNQLRAGGPIASGNNSKATQLATDMSKLMKGDREKSFSETERKSFTDAGDEFRTYCNLQDGQCVFLIHVPELHRFTAGAKESLGDAGWFFAEALLGKGRERIRLAVALHGGTTYERVITGRAPGQFEKWDLKPVTYNGFRCEDQLISWFGPRMSEAGQFTPLTEQTNGQHGSTNGQ